MTSELDLEQLEKVACEAIGDEPTDETWQHERYRVRRMVPIDGLTYVAETMFDVDATHIATFDPPTVLALIARLREAEAKVERVREVHEPIDAMLNPGRHERVVKVCTGCGTDDGNWQRWPCPTIRALDAN